MAQEKVYNSGNKTLTIVEYDTGENPDIQIESQDNFGMYLYEFEDVDQLDDIIEYLMGVRDRWKQ